MLSVIMSSGSSFYDLDIDLDSQSREPYLFGAWNGESSAVTEKSEIVELSNGLRIQGLTYAGGLSTFRGIPYASPPVGDLRFKPPVDFKKANSDEVMDCSDWGNYCLQRSGGSEDCLFLNVFVNLEVARKSKAPVAIFVHGGSYNSGASNQYDGAYNVDYWQGEGIIVTINYRLNVFGFLGSNELRENGDGTVGMWGIQDQRMAFKWVKENIELFGGDPDRVMIFGESAGAGSMSNHLTNKNSWPFFNSVALESGSMSQWSMQPMSLAETKYAMVLEATNCADADCLKSMSADQLYASIGNLTLTTDSSSGYTFWAPVCDGVEATEHPWFSAKKGVVHDVPILHGTNTDEGGMFTALDKQSATHKQLEFMWSSAGYLDADKMEALYVTDKQYPTEATGYSPYWYAGERSVGDIAFSCPDKFAADTISKHVKDGTLQNAKSYVYHFEHIPVYGEPEKMYVDHAAELAFTFHLRYLMENNGTDIATADLMSTYWGNFLLSSDPNHSHSFGVQLEKEGIAPWTTYSFDQVNVHTVAEGTAAGVKNIGSFKTDECDYLIPVLEEKIKESFAS